MTDHVPDDDVWRQPGPVVGIPTVAAPEATTEAAPEAASPPPFLPAQPAPVIPDQPVTRPAPQTIRTVATGGQGGGPGGGPGAAVAAAGPPAGPEPKRPSSLRSIVEWIIVGGTALLLAILIHAVLFQTFFIPSASMTPTLKIHDRILVNKLAYDFHPVHRGDIVVFKRGALHGIPNDEIKDLVKRVVGLPGETVSTSPDGHVEINGKILAEKYLPAGVSTVPGFAPIVIPAHHYWVMGDNRTNSADSRVFGPIDKNVIVGRAFVLIWPLSDLGVL